jgi:ankyrin repeat protein
MLRFKLVAIAPAVPAIVLLVLIAGADRAGAETRELLAKREELNLVAAAGAGQRETVEILLKQGESVNQADSDGTTPLMAAAEAGESYLVSQLIAAGADLDATDEKGRTALYRAIDAGCSPEAALLIEAGSHPGVRTDDGRNPASLALDKDNTEIARAILEEWPRIPSWGKCAMRALIRAIRRGDTAMASLLLNLHKTPPPLWGRQETLLGYVVAYRRPDVLKILLEAGANPDTRLQIPAERHFIDVVNEPKLNFYLEREQGMTALMLAAGLGRLEMVDLLLEYGARRGAATDHYRMAALSFAARGNHLAVMQRLLGKDPDPSRQRMYITISLANQRATLYKDGEPILRTEVSTGRENYETPTGRFVITDKHRRRMSNIYEVEMPYFMRLSCSAVGMHAGYLPGYPASHGCIRMPKEAAREMFHLVDVGTLVSISP